MPSTVWKSIAIALMTFILGAGATWLNDRDHMTKEQVMEMIHAEAPRLTDYSAIKDEIVAMQVAQARTDEKLDLLLKRLSK